jgi:NAD(P)H-hydrate epimerase
MTIGEANKSSAYRVSLDIPTGFLGDPEVDYFKADAVMTLAAPKTILEMLPSSTELFLGDLGIPGEVYQKFGMIIPPFHRGQLLQLLKTEI